jgi:hypothetical protein
VALAPADSRKGKVVKVPSLTARVEFRWQPEKAMDGPISIIMSGADWRVLVYRNGVEIGRSKLAVSQPKQPFGTHAFIMGLFYQKNGLFHDTHESLGISDLQPKYLFQLYE